MLSGEADQQPGEIVLENYCTTYRFPPQAACLTKKACGSPEQSSHAPSCRITLTLISPTPDRATATASHWVLAPLIHHLYPNGHCRWFHSFPQRFCKCGCCPVHLDKQRWAELDCSIKSPKEEVQFIPCDNFVTSVETFAQAITMS